MLKSGAKSIPAAEWSMKDVEEMIEATLPKPFRQRPYVSGMANENTTVVLGIPIPSTDPVFLAIVGVHVLFGLAALITGAIAMLSKKGR
jgi:hypothetical protein